MLHGQGVEEGGLSSAPNLPTITARRADACDVLICRPSSQAPSSPLCSAPSPPPPALFVYRARLARCQRQLSRSCTWCARPGQDAVQRGGRRVAEAHAAGARGGRGHLSHEPNGRQAPGHPVPKHAGASARPVRALCV
eukprot:364179-Chlamydomonas_euryale.AAC.4